VVRTLLAQLTISRKIFLSFSVIREDSWKNLQPICIIDGHSPERQKISQQEIWQMSGLPQTRQLLFLNSNYFNETLWLRGAPKFQWTLCANTKNCLNANTTTRSRQHKQNQLSVAEEIFVANDVWIESLLNKGSKSEGFSWGRVFWSNLGRHCAVEDAPRVGFNFFAFFFGSLSAI
jgi:hypothetical protein